MPGDHTLTIECWDHDLLGDDLIGKAIVDIENRWYAKRWWDHPEPFISKRPKELLPLWSPMSGVPQGRLECWIDTLTDTQDGEIPVEKLEMPKGEPWELRCICWRVEDIVFRDRESIDMYVTGTLSYKDVQDNKEHHLPREETDCQWFVAPGDPGIFHWRWIFPAKIPSKDPRLLVQTWDMDLLSANDSLAEANLALSGFFKKADQQKSQQTAELSISMTHPNYSGVQGTIKLSLDALPEEEAKQMPVPHQRLGDVSADPEADRAKDDILLKDFKRPPGVLINMFSGMSMSMFDMYGGAKRKMMMYCAAICVVLILGAVAYIAVAG